MSIERIMKRWAPYQLGQPDRPVLIIDVRRGWRRVGEKPPHISIEDKSENKSTVTAIMLFVLLISIPVLRVDFFELKCLDLRQ